MPNLLNLLPSPFCLFLFRANTGVCPYIFSFCLVPCAFCLIFLSFLFRLDILIIDYDLRTAVPVKPENLIAVL